MTSRWLVALIAAALAAEAPISTSAARQQTPAPPAQNPQQVFRAGVDLVSLTVAVTDGTGRYVTDLGRDEFTVFEDGVRQELTFFTKSQLPIALALLLDTSASMEDKMTTVQAAAVGFAKTLRTEDLGEVIDFDSRVEILQKFTNSVGDLEKAIRQTSAGGSTSLHNAIYISLKELKKIQAKGSEDVRRQAIIVLSDGEDTSSLVSFEEVLDLAKRSEVAIYTIGIRSREPSTAKGFKEAEFVLRQLAQETGGKAFFPNSAADLTNVYGQIAEELSSQYTLGYTSRNPRRDGQWRRVVVRVQRKEGREGLIARTKQGYYAPTSH